MRYFILIGGFIIFFMSAFRHWDGFTINGRITDAAGNALSSVSVSVKGKSMATTTDANGAFALKVPGEKVTLIVSAVGYVPQEISVSNNGKAVNIKLVPASAGLQEVVVTGYGTQNKRGDTRTYRQKSGDKEMKSMPSGHNLNGVLAGRVPGLEIGKPAGDPSVITRYPQNGNFNTEGYDAIVENRFLASTDNPLSTFSIDVDAASYSNVRRFLQQGQLPPAGAVRIEELINYFKYDYPQPVTEHPFSINTEIAECPWNQQTQVGDDRIAG